MTSHIHSCTFTDDTLWTCLTLACHLFTFVSGLHFEGQMGIFLFYFWVFHDINFKYFCFILRISVPEENAGVSCTIWWQPRLNCDGQQKHYFLFMFCAFSFHFRMSLNIDFNLEM